MKKVIGASLALMLLALAGVAPAAQQDLAKALTGTWKGEVQVQAASQQGGPQHDSPRTLVIENVKQQDGKWIAKAKFGTDPKLTPVDVKIDSSGKDVVLSFETPAKSLVKLTLQNKSLVGSLHLDAGGGKQFPMKLDKSK